MKRKAILIAVGFLISAGALYWFVRSVKDPAKVWRALQEADYLLVLAACAINFCCFFFIRTLRWQLLLKPTRRVGYWKVFRATCIGFMTSNVLPLRVGEIVRPYVLHRSERIPFGKVLGTAIGLERPFDYLGLTILVLITWPLLPERVADARAMNSVAQSSVAAVQSAEGAEPSADEAPARERDTERRYARVRKVGWILVGVMAAAVTVMLLVGRFPEFFTRAAERMLFFLPHSARAAVTRFIGHFTQSMTFMRCPGLVLLAAVESGVIWSCVAMSNYVLNLAFGLGLPVVASFFCTVAICLAISLPQAPGFLGVFNAAALLAMELFGARGGSAWAFAAVLWAISIIPVIPVGLACMWYEGLHLGSMVKAAEESAREAEAQQR